ncbi:MAG TPA: AAA family ATPase [Gammaproteobacteria bacterium]|nr:AAA family ATPase [Gammaproteobacteria bacterium]
MYTEFFGLTEKPFSITPDPRYLYMSVRHADALAHLIYGISESGGFIQLTGEVGTGKTTLIRSLLEQLPEKAEIAVILNPQLSGREFLQVICEELGTAAPSEQTVKGLVDALNAHLLERHAAGKRVVLIVDEAQTLSPELLEQVRLLTNLETAKQKLLQIILIGQPELRDLLGRAEMRQIAQRVTGRYHLEPLTKDDTAAYVRHRMRVAGAQSDVFKASAVRRLYSGSRGIPRLINVVADRALLAAYTQDRHNVDGKLIDKAAAEVFGRRRPAGRWWPWAAVAVGIASFALATTNLWQRHREAAVEQPAAQARPADASLAGAPATALGATGQVLAGAPPAADASGVPLTLADLLRNPSFRTDRDGAIGELLSLWGADYDPTAGDPCHQAEIQGLRCLALDRGSLSELRRVNWPAILQLVDDHGAEHHVVITALGYDAATVVANGKTFKLPLAELAYSWYGDQLLVWRPLIARPLTPGIRDSDVLWLRDTLARIRGEEPPADGSPLYDRALETEVRRYQREHMLTVDGIVGARTQVALVADLDVPGTPSLLEEN